MKLRMSRAAGLAFAGLVLLPAPAAPVCTGDCDGNRTVTVAELVQGVEIALGDTSASCTAFDRNGDDSVTVDELAVAVDAALNGCPPEATPTPVNQAPVIPDLPVYRTYPGYPIQFPINAKDPEGGALAYAGTNLPDGAQLDPATGILSWMPGPDQLGPFYAQFSVTDQGTPPAAANGVLPLKVSPLDACTVAGCDPASGCESELVPLDTACCAGEPQTRVAEPEATCPGGLVLQVGRNRDSGFGQLYNCDRLRAAGGAQGGGTLRLNIRARCVNAAQLLTVDVLLLTADPLLPLLINHQHQTIFVDVLPDGWAQRLGLSFALPRTAAPDGTEANLTVTLTDADGVVVQDAVRVTLTPNALPDLPD